jgi:dTDP-4-amino-4,6-dideoxygalactose transaminase
LRLLPIPSESEIGRKIDACPNAKFLIDHVIYLPIHKNVPFKGVDRIAEILRDCLDELDDSGKIKSKL